MSSQAKASGGTDPAGKPALTEEQSKQRAEKLDKAAQTLLLIFGALSTIFALLGATGNRVWNLLDQDEQSLLLRLSLGLAGAAILLVLIGLVLPARHVRWESFVLILAPIAYTLSLILAVYAIGQAADRGTRPDVQEVLLIPAATGRTLTFVATADSVDVGQAVGVLVLSTPNPLDPNTSPPTEELYAATVRPNASGEAEQRISIPLPENAREIRVVVYQMRSTSDAHIQKSRQLYQKACFTRASTTGESTADTTGESTADTTDEPLADCVSITVPA